MRLMLDVRNIQTGNPISTYYDEATNSAVYTEFLSDRNLVFTVTQAESTIVVTIVDIGTGLSTFVNLEECSCMDDALNYDIVKDIAPKYFPEWIPPQTLEY